MSPHANAPKASSAKAATGQPPKQQQRESWLTQQTRRLLSGATFDEALDHLKPGGTIAKLTGLVDDEVKDLKRSAASLFGLKKKKKAPAAAAQASPAPAPPAKGAPAAPAKAPANPMYNNDDAAAPARSAPNPAYNNMDAAAPARPAANPAYNNVDAAAPAGHAPNPAYNNTDAAAPARQAANPAYNNDAGSSTSPYKPEAALPVAPPAPAAKSPYKPEAALPVTPAAPAAKSPYKPEAALPVTPPASAAKSPYKPEAALPVAPAAPAAKSPYKPEAALPVAAAAARAAATETVGAYRDSGAAADTGAYRDSNAAAASETVGAYRDSGAAADPGAYRDSGPAADPGAYRNGDAGAATAGAYQGAASTAVDYRGATSHHADPGRAAVASNNNNNNALGSGGGGLDDVDTVGPELDARLYKPHELDIAREVETRRVAPVERTDPATADVITAQLLARLRANGAAHERTAGRVDLTPDERRQQGFALIGVGDGEASWDSDKGESEGQEGFWRTRYHYGSQDEVDSARAGIAHKGSSQDASRADYVFQLVGGKLVKADDHGKGLETNNAAISNLTINMAYRKRAAELGVGTITPEEKAKVKARVEAEGGRYIWVMNSAGEFFCGRNLAGIQHHSSFLAGGAVAAAGDMVASGGQVKLLSNESGHYKPGPAYLWQALLQMRSRGVDLTTVKVEINGVMEPFPHAAAFFAAMDPMSEPRYFNTTWAVLALNDASAAAKRGPAAAPAPRAGHAYSHDRGAASNNNNDIPADNPGPSPYNA